MSARARREQGRQSIEVRKVHRSGEHAIGLDEVIRRQFERAFASELESTSRISRFDLDDMLARPDVRPSDPPAVDAPIVGMPIVNVVADDYEAITVGTLPPPAVETDHSD